MWTTMTANKQKGKKREIITVVSYLTSLCTDMKSELRTHTSWADCTWQDVPIDRERQSLSEGTKNTTDHDELQHIFYLLYYYDILENNLFSEFCWVLLLEDLVWVSLTCPVHRPTTRSAMKVSSVSPERWLTITPQPFSWASLHLRAAGSTDGVHALTCTPPVRACTLCTNVYA